MTTDKPIGVTSMEDSINKWGTLFKDLDEGGDTIRWQEFAIGTYAPALLLGQEGNGIKIGAILEPDDEVQLSFPAFFDEDPLPQSQAGAKTKFRGKTREGIIAITNKYLSFSFGLDGSLCMTFKWDLGDVKALNQLTFKFSKLSMTAAGPGYEILIPDIEEPERLVFRVSLMPVADDYEFTKLLRNQLKLDS
jgi:hypothetical protein